jgi:tetratricopeptide (TPR) repeat protein
LGRAANYMLLYSSTYPESAEAGNYKSQATSLMELTGQADDAIEANLEAKNLLHAVELATKFGRWEKVQQISATMPGGVGLYYQGLSFWRQGKKAEALALLQRCVSERAEAGSAELQAHAGIILAENQIGELLAMQKETFSVALLQKILELSKNTNLTLQGVLQQQSRRWSVASLAVTGRLNFELARVLSQAAAPAGMSPEAFKKIVGPKIADYVVGAKAANVRCLELSEKESILSEYTAMCRPEGKVLVTEAVEMKSSPLGKKPAVSMTAAVRVQLLKAPKSVESLKAALKLNDSEGNFYGAYAVASRITEIDATSAQAWSNLGKAALKISNRNEALSAFKSALKINPGENAATQGIAQIMGSTSGRRMPAAGSH